MDIVKDCILMKEFSKFSYDSLKTDMSPYAVGVILAMPIQSNSLAMLSCLLDIAESEDVLITVRIGGLCKFFRFFSDIQRCVDVKTEKNQIFSLLSKSCILMNKLFDLQENKEIKDFLLKSFKRSIERLTFEFRTKLEVLRLVTCVMKYKIFSDFPSLIYKIPARVVENAINLESISYQSLYSTTEDVWLIIKTFKTKEFDPIKNILFFLICELVKKTESSTITQTSNLLMGYFNHLNKSQEFKILTLYKLQCQNIGTEADSSICLKFGELITSVDEPSVWDLVEETPVYMDVEINEPVPETTKKVLELLKGIHAREYLKYDVIEKEILGISKNYKKDHPLIFKTIVETIETEDKTKMKFWKTFVSAARKNRFLSYDESKKISDLISRIERDELRDNAGENEVRKVAGGTGEIMEKGWNR